MSTPGSLTVHKSFLNHWAAWPLKPSTTTIVIADSQFRRVKNIPDNWEVHAFPGIRLATAEKVVPKLTGNNLKNIVVHVGINNKGCQWEGSAQGDANKLLASLNRTGCKIFFCGVSIPDSASTKERDVLIEINKHARKRLSANFIAPLPSDQVSVAHDNHHYEPNTVDKIFENIVNFLSKGPPTRPINM